MSLINPKLLHKTHQKKIVKHTYIQVETTFDVEHSALSRPEEVKELAAFHARYMHTTSLKYLQHI